MATSSITDNVVLSLDATKKLAEMDQRRENILEIIRAKTMKAAGDSK